MSLQYRIKLRRGDFELECEGDKAFVLELLKRYAPDAPLVGVVPSPTRSVKATADQPASPTAPTKQIPPGEFIRRVASTKHVDFVLAFGYYLEKITGLAAFTPADLKNCYYEAKLETSNTSQMIIMNIKKGFMMPAKKGDSEKQKYTLTRSGEELVESLLDKNQSKAE